MERSWDGLDVFTDLLCVTLGCGLLVGREKSLESVVIIILTMGVLDLAYVHFIPGCMPILVQPPLVRWLGSIMVTCVIVGAICKVADASIYVVLFAVTAVVTYQLLTVVWSLEPPEEWNQAKVCVSIFSGLTLASIVSDHLLIAARLVSIVLGGILVGSASQSLYTEIPISEVLSVCLGYGGCPLDVRKCSAFYISFLAIIVTTALVAAVRELKRSTLQVDRDAYRSIVCDAENLPISNRVRGS